MSPEGLKKTNFQKFKKKTKKNWVLQTLVFNKKQYLFLWSVSEQKLDFFNSNPIYSFNKTCPYKISDRKIIKVEHNIIDSSRCFIFIV
jgi:hypothetical protein